MSRKRHIYIYPNKIQSKCPGMFETNCTVWPNLGTLATTVLKCSVIGSSTCKQCRSHNLQPKVKIHIFLNVITSFSKSQKKKKLETC